MHSLLDKFVYKLLSTEGFTQTIYILIYGSLRKYSDGKSIHLLSSVGNSQQLV